MTHDFLQLWKDLTRERAKVARSLCGWGDFASQNPRYDQLESKKFWLVQSMQLCLL